MKILLECQVDGIASKVDGTVSVKISTQELDSSKAGELFAMRGKHCKFLLSDSNITTLEAELVDNAQIASVKKNKTESQRLRAVLFLVHQNAGSDLEFEQWYKNKMEEIIAHYKKSLD